MRNKKGAGFSMAEILVALGILGVIAAMALPSAVALVQSYRFHSTSSGVASFLNVARMRAASQYRPYGFDINNTATPVSYVIEKLTQTTYNPLSPTVSYASLSPQQWDDSGFQYFADSNLSASVCKPAGITPFPSPITADPSSCTGPFQICFNTRGLPVQCASGTAGTPLPNGGIAIYVQNPQGMTDAVTVAAGGSVQVWNWSSTSAQWYLR
jgi:prepilin-type N-terminal cleavage/methylation domain-containing protein